MDGGRGRTRTGTPVSQKQILSPSAAVCPSPCFSTEFIVMVENTLEIKDNLRTVADID
jgi:hypothetical protein